MADAASAELRARGRHEHKFRLDTDYAHPTAPLPQNAVLHVVLAPPSAEGGEKRLNFHAEVIEQRLESAAPLAGLRVSGQWHPLLVERAVAGTLRYHSHTLKLLDLSGLRNAPVEDMCRLVFERCVLPKVQGLHLPVPAYQQAHAAYVCHYARAAPLTELRYLAVYGSDDWDDPKPPASTKAQLEAAAVVPWDLVLDREKPFSDVRLYHTGLEAPVEDAAPPGWRATVEADGVERPERLSLYRPRSAADTGRTFSERVLRV